MALWNKMMVKDFLKSMFKLMFQQLVRTAASYKLKLVQTD